MGLRRWVMILFVTAVAALAIAYGFMPRPVPTDVVRVSRGQLRVTVEEEGKTRVKDRYTVSATVAGFLRRIDLDVGDTLKKGSTVAVLEPTRSSVLDARARAEATAVVSVARATQKGAEERRRAAEAASVYAEKKLERTTRLFKGGFVASDEMDRVKSETEGARAQLAVAEADVRAAASELKKARAVLGYSATAEVGRVVSLPSPIDGTVLKIYRKSEGVVQASDPLMDIGDAGRLEVIAEVLSADAVRIKKGAVVFLERWGGKEALKGRVRTIEPAGFTKVSSLGVEEQRVNVISDIIEMPKDGQSMGDGFRVDAKFVIWEGASVLRVPVSSLFRHSDGWAVFVVSDGRAQRRALRVGHTNGLFAEVVSGVTEGELVIARPDDAISEGVRVRAR